MATYSDIITSTQTGTGSGSLVPDEQRKEILQGLPAASAVLQLARKVMMSTKTEKQPVSVRAADRLLGDRRHGPQADERRRRGRTRRSSAEELAVIVPVPENLINDSSYDLFAELRPRIVEALGVALDAACLFGTNAPAGFTDAIVPQAAAAGNTVATGASSSMSPATSAT
jgi:HK97 family phage major capsid protein